MNAIRTYLRWKPVIKQFANAFAAWRAGDLKTAWHEVMIVIEPALWAFAGAFAGAAADTIQASFTAGALHIDPQHVLWVGLAAGGVALRAYFQERRDKKPAPEPL